MISTATLTLLLSSFAFAQPVPQQQLTNDTPERSASSLPLPPSTEPEAHLPHRCPTLPPPTRRRRQLPPHPTSAGGRQGQERRLRDRPVRQQGRELVPERLPTLPRQAHAPREHRQPPHRTS